MQVNYLIDEAVDTGKGGNTVISMLHPFFSTYGMGERVVHLHADNCVGQNKNNYVMQASTVLQVCYTLNTFKSCDSISCGEFRLVCMKGSPSRSSRLGTRSSHRIGVSAF